MDSIQMQDENGNWVPAKPEPLRCEYLGCHAEVTINDQYIRKDRNLPNGWGDEPEFLCKEHAVGRLIFVATAAKEVTPKIDTLQVKPIRLSEYLEGALSDFDRFIKGGQDWADLQMVIMRIFWGLSYTPAIKDNHEDDKYWVVKEDLYQVASGLARMTTKESKEERKNSILWIIKYLKKAISRMKESENAEIHS